MIKKPSTCLGHNQGNRVQRAVRIRPYAFNNFVVPIRHFPKICRCGVIHGDERGKRILFANSKPKD